jgi:hypothetical protein
MQNPTSVESVLGVIENTFEFQTITSRGKVIGLSSYLMAVGSPIKSPSKYLKNDVFASSWIRSW